MLDWVHSHTTNLGPAVPLHSELVVSITSLEHWLFCSSSTCNLPNHSTASAGNNLLGSRRKLDPGGIVVRVVADNNSVITRRPSEGSAVPNMVLDVTDDGSLRDRSERQHISDHQIGLLPAVDELTGVDSLGGDEELVLLLVPKRMAEADAGQRGTATGIVDDLGDYTLEVAVALAEVEATEARRTLSVVGVRLEHGTRTLTLSSDDPPHGAGE